MTNFLGKVQKPVGNFRDIPPVPQEDIVQVQKSFARVAPPLPTAAPLVKAQVPQGQFQQPRAPLSGRRRDRRGDEPGRGRRVHQMVLVPTAEGLPAALSQ